MRVQYQARKRDGELVSGELETGSLVDARQQLRAKGLFVTAITEVAAGKTAVLAGQTSRLPGRIKRQDLVMMTSQLTIMCQSGVDLAEALENLAQQAHKPALRAVLKAVHSDVAGGCSLSDALARHPRVFDSAFVATIAAGEQSGTISQVLERLSKLMRGDLRLMNTVWSMLMYPIVLALVTFVVINALVFVVLPQFATVFENLDRPVPPFTQALLAIGTFVRGHLLLVIGGILAVGTAAFLAHNTRFVRRNWDHATLHLALVRDATRSLLTGRALRLLGTMLTSGVPLVDGIRLCQRAARNGLFRELFERAERNVLNGEGLGRPLIAVPFLPPGAAQMVVTAEQSGKMGEVLVNIGEYYEDQGEVYLRNLVKIAEPAVVVTLGVVVAGIVLSIVIPMLDVSTIAK